MTQLVSAVLLLVAIASQPAALRIVVIEGEDAVNVIQQKTAVRPVVEVRDRNDVPVAGVLVTFSIEGGKAASFGGASTLTVATNAAGQAAVSSLTPSAAGAFQIQVSAAFQGQVATATIAQTNVMTAAQAAAAASAGTTGSASGGGGGAGAGGGAAGGGGGVSATTVGIVGAAVGGGALAATQLVKEEDGGDERFTGTMTGQVVSTSVGAGGSVVCTITRSVSADVSMTIAQRTETSIRGIMEFNVTDNVVSSTCPGPGRMDRFVQSFEFSGTPSSFTARHTGSETGAVIGDPRLTRQSTREILIEGSMTSDTVTATLKFNERSTITGGEGGVVNESATGTFPFTLRRVP